MLPPSLAQATKVPWPRKRSCDRRNRSSGLDAASGNRSIAGRLSTGKFRTGGKHQPRTCHVVASRNACSCDTMLQHSHIQQISFPSQHSVQDLRWMSFRVDEAETIPGADPSQLSSDNTAIHVPQAAAAVGGQAGNILRAAEPGTNVLRGQANDVTEMNPSTFAGTPAVNESPQYASAPADYGTPSGFDQPQQDFAQHNPASHGAEHARRSGNRRDNLISRPRCQIHRVLVWDHRSLVLHHNSTTQHHNSATRHHNLAVSHQNRMASLPGATEIPRQRLVSARQWFSTGTRLPASNIRAADIGDLDRSQLHHRFTWRSATRRSSITERRHPKTGAERSQGWQASLVRNPRPKCRHGRSPCRPGP